MSSQIKLLKHKTSRDTAIQIIERLDNNMARVRFWNITQETALIDLRDEEIKLDKPECYEEITIVTA